jgi:Kef-type K+ transport system membrane component KefB
LVLSSSTFELVIIFGAILLTALLSRVTSLPITPLEILMGILLVNFFAFSTPDSISAIITLGSLLIVFLAGYETGISFLKINFRKAMTIGLAGFLVPFFALLFALTQLVHAPLIDSLIGATTLSDTSISIVYTTLKQYDITNLPFGRLILAGTLMINLVEDTAVTAITSAISRDILFVSAIIGVLLVSAIGLPRLVRFAEKRFNQTFSNITMRAILLSLAILSALTTLIQIPGILFIFLTGLMFSQIEKDKGTSENEAFVKNLTKFSFAVFVPLYFLAVGLKVSLPAVLTNLPVILILLSFATAFKVLGVYPTVRRYFDSSQTKPISVLFNTRLTSATVILLLSLTLGLITEEWYSIFISVVVILALGSSIILRAFPSFAGSEVKEVALLGNKLGISPDNEQTKT